MPFTVQPIPIESYAGVTIQNRSAGESSQRLVVMLPGLGYTVDAPLFHYLSKVIWANGDDVLLVQYGFQVAQSDYDPLKQGDITQESLQAITTALEMGNYDDLVIIGKSLGTPMAALFANHFDLTSKLILLTPIQNCHQLVEDTPTLAIIGTEDSRYADDLAIDTDILRWKVYEGLNHSLEASTDVMASLKILPDIIQTCAEFLLFSASLR